MKLFGNGKEWEVEKYIEYRRVLLNTLLQLKKEHASSSDSKITHARKKAIAEVSAIVAYFDLHFPVFEGFTVYTPQKSYTKDSFQKHINNNGLHYEKNYINRFFFLENKLYRLSSDKVLEEVETAQNFVEKYSQTTKHQLASNFDVLNSEIIVAEDWLKLVPCDPNTHDTYLTEILSVGRTGPVFGEKLSGTTVDSIYIDIFNLYVRLNAGLKFACQDHSSIQIDRTEAHFFVNSHDSRRGHALQYDQALHKENMKIIHQMAIRYVGSEHAWLRKLGKGLLYTAAILLIAAGIAAAIPSGGLSLAAVIAGSAVIVGLSGVGMYKTRYKDLAKSIDEIELPAPQKPKH